MNRSSRIFAAILVLTTLVPTTFVRSNIICVESSGRISYGCDDVVPDEMRTKPAIPVQFGFSSEDCGFCHDYAVGHTLTQPFERLVPPLPVKASREIVLGQFHSLIKDALLPVPVIDTSGSISPLKC